MKLKKAIRDVIIGNAGVVAQLATYEFTRDVETPAVFTSRIIPEDCGYPAVHITQVSSIPWGTRANRGGEMLVDVDVYNNKTQSDKALNDVAHDIWRLLDRVALTISGYDHVLCSADPPMQTGDDDGFPGYVITCRVKALET